MSKLIRWQKGSFYVEIVPFWTVGNKKFPYAGIGGPHFEAGCSPDGLHMFLGRKPHSIVYDGGKEGENGGS